MNEACAVFGEILACGVDCIDFISDLDIECVVDEIVDVEHEKQFGRVFETDYETLAFGL